MDSESDQNLIEERKEKLAKFIGSKKGYIIYLLLFLVLAVSAYIRTRPIPKLKDITTNTWTLGPDLDPFLFLRWAEHIVENGKLMVIDTMRNVPLGFNTSGEMKLLAYFIAWFHNFLSMFGWSDSITYSAILFPVAAFSLSAIAFFIFSRKVFSDENKIIQNLIALVSTALFVLMPSLLPRTIAGIPEKESIAFFFMFLIFFFFICSYTESSSKKSYLYALLAGISTALMSLAWGGSGLVFLTIAATVFFTFILGKINKVRLFSYGIWILSSFLLPQPFSTRFNLGNLFYSLSTGAVFAIFFLMAIHIYIIERLEKKEGIKHFFEKIPSTFISIILIAIIFSIIFSLYFGFDFIPHQIGEIVAQSVHPLDVSRFGLTVAENKQPFFLNDWKDSFGPIVKGIPLFFWLFIAGSILLFYKMVYSLNKKERVILTSSYTIFLFSLIFSKYSGSSILNGNSAVSLIVYFGGMIFFVLSFLFVYFKRYKKKELGVFQQFSFGYILYFV
ncbi:MAG: STT3 domain-containing protein, partial [Nanoarchaeota archaeon]